MRGGLADRPWGVALGAIAQSRAAAQVVLQADDGKKFIIAFDNGAVVGASSPLAADSIARVALTTQLVSSSQVQEIARKIAAFPGRDEVALLADIAKLSAEQIVRLRRRMILQRAARSFTVDRGVFEVQEDLTVPVVEGVGIDIARVIFLGASMNLSELRLAADLRQMGARFEMTADASRHLDRFGFSAAAKPILEDLCAGTSLPELDAKHRDVEPRTMQAVIYALVATELCTGAPAIGIREIKLDDVLPTPVAPRPDRTAPRPERPPARASRTSSRQDLAPVSAARSARLPSIEDAPARTRTATFEPPTALRRSPLATGSNPPPAVARTVTPRRNVIAVRATIAAGLTLVDQGADHYALLGLPPDASVDAVRSAYVRYLSQLHPEKLPPLGVAELRDANRLFGHINTAFQVLTDPVRRADYEAGLGHAGLAAGTGTRTEAGVDAATKVKLAAAASQRGLAALNRDDTVRAIGELSHAVELCPQDVDHQSTLAWAKFCAAPDKALVAQDTRRVLERALFKTHNPVIPRLYLGRVERMLGRTREALHHFREVIALEPDRHEARSEIRLLEQRSDGRRR